MDLPLALTMGDPSGIGIELALVAWMARRERHLPAFYLLADPDVVASRASDLGLDVQLQKVSPNEAMSAFPSSFPIVPLDNACRNVMPGQPSENSVPAILEAIERAVDHTLDGQSAAVVTNPISKKILYDAGFRHPGHTEYLGALAADRTGRPVTPVMMIAGPDLRVVPVTIHIPLKDVIDALNCEAIVEVGQITAEALRRNFGIVSPRIAVSGVNPHAGEDGALGVEEKSIIEPAVETLRKSGIDASGPYPADTMFHARARAGYDAALCMYHDQALVPAKTLAFDEAVNVTLGLPFIRTSPDHGTAFDIAGKGKARPDSLCAALHMAASMAREHDTSDSAPADTP